MDGVSGDACGGEWGNSDHFVEWEGGGEWGDDGRYLEVEVGGE